MQSLHPRNGTGQQVGIGAASARTANATTNGCTDVRLIATADCWVAVGNSTVAAAPNVDMYLPAQPHVEYLSLGSGSYIAAIQVSAGGTLYVIEMTK